MVDNKVTFHVQKRELLGKKVSQLKKQGMIPGNVYGLKQDSVALQLDQKELEKQLRFSDTGLVYLKIDGGAKVVPVLIDQVDRDVLTGQLMHISFRRVNLTEKVTTDVEIVLVGENDVPDSTVLQVLDTLEVESLPTEIPENITLDVSQLTEVGQSITIQDVISQTNVSIICDEDDLQNPVVVLQEFVEEVEEEPELPPETEIIGKGKEDEEDGVESEGEDRDTTEESESEKSE